MTCLSDRWGQIAPFQKYALALNPRSKDFLSVSPDVRTEIWSELEEKTHHFHEGQEPVILPDQEIPRDPFSRFSVVHDLRSEIQDEIARWKAEKSIKIRQWNVTDGKWEYSNIYQWWKSRAERFPLLSIIAQQVFKGLD